MRSIVSAEHISIPTGSVHLHSVMDACTQPLDSITSIANLELGRTDADQLQETSGLQHVGAMGRVTAASIPVAYQRQVLAVHM